MCEAGRGLLNNTRVITIQLNRAQKNSKKKQKVDQKILWVMKLSETVIFVFMIRAIARIRSAITSPYPHAVNAVQNIPLFINLSTDVFFPPEDSAALSHARENEHDMRGKKTIFTSPHLTCSRLRDSRVRLIEKAQTRK